MSQITTVCISLAVSASSIGVPVAAPGEKAPHLGGGQWIQGEPIKTFETGRIYVLEFWSTWCAACIAPIDHLNKLAHRYENDATFIAIHIWPRDSAPRPSEFLKMRRAAKNSEYEFSIVEDVDGVLAEAWMDATQNGGLPTAMIIDRNSRLAWFGHSKDIDNPLKQIIEGTYDSTSAVGIMNRKILVGRMANESGEAIRAGNYEKGMALMLEALRADPGTVVEWIPSTYGHLLHASKSKEVAASFVRKVLETKEGENADLIVGFAQMILVGQSSERCDLILALELAEKADAITRSQDPDILSTLARVRARMNDLSGAMTAIRLAIQNTTVEGDRKRFLKTLAELETRSGI
jgi:thiol-disulfide isomerase/thioredoxin/plastocyanin